MNEQDKATLLTAIRTEVEIGIRRGTEHIEAHVKALGDVVENLRHTSEERERKLADEVGRLRSEFRRTQELAERAARVADESRTEMNSAYEGMKAHTGLIEEQIRGFSKQVEDIKDENTAQTNKIDTVIATLNSLSIRDEAREKAEIARAAVEKHKADSQETFWKRLPVYLVLATTAVGVVVWLFNALLLQNQINKLPKGEVQAAPSVTVGR